VRRWSLLLVLVIAAGACGTGVGSSQPESLCKQAKSVLAQPGHEADGDQLVAQLHQLDLVGLTPSDQEAIGATVKALDKDVKALDQGKSVHGWSTADVVDQINRVCGAHLTPISVAP
jgi:hypothetical protein